LSAWLPAAFFTLSLAFLVQFRRQKTMDPYDAVRVLTNDPWAVLLLAVPVLVAATLVIQAFSFEAIRALEGYWARLGPSSWLRTFLIRRQLRRKSRLHERRITTSHRAFLVARGKWLEAFPTAIVDALEKDALEQERPDLDDEYESRLSRLDWWALSPPWQVAKVERLLAAEREFPRDSRILPTKLGNVLRATEDRLKNAGEDLEGFALRGRELVSPRVQQQHDQFRTRLDMYSILTLVAPTLAVLTPALLIGTLDRGWLSWIITLAGLFALTTWASYRAAIASARGYSTSLRQMDQAFVTAPRPSVRAP
jgi:hypothetical protein